MASGESKIDRKLDYVNNTKALIRQAMTNKGIDVTDNTTFREYADLINNLVIEKDQTDATVTPNDMVAGKIAYNDNNKVVGTLTEYSKMTSEATEINDKPDEEMVSGYIQTDNRTLLSKNAKVTIDMPYNRISGYVEAMDICDDILGENDEQDAIQAFNILNEVTGVVDTYEGMGGSFSEIMQILNQII